MTTIRDRAVRDLQPVFGETGPDGTPLAYCCDGPCGEAGCVTCPEPCPHRTCAAVLALTRADLLDWPGGHDEPPADPHYAAARALQITAVQRGVLTLERDLRGLTETVYAAAMSGHDDDLKRTGALLIAYQAMGPILTALESVRAMVRAPYSLDELDGITPAAITGPWEREDRASLMFLAAAVHAAGGTLKIRPDHLRGVDVLTREDRTDGTIVLTSGAAR